MLLHVVLRGERPLRVPTCLWRPTVTPFIFSWHMSDASWGGLAVMGGDTGAIKQRQTAELCCHCPASTARAAGPQSSEVRPLILRSHPRMSIGLSHGSMASIYCPPPPPPACTYLHTYRFRPAPSAQSRPLPPSHKPNCPRRIDRRRSMYVCSKLSFLSASRPPAARLIGPWVVCQVDLVLRVSAHSIRFLFLFFWSNGIPPGDWKETRLPPVSFFFLRVWAIFAFNQVLWGVGLA